ncbi:MAG: NADPH-dependent FMN reductase [Roseibacillus sp.]
MKILSLGGSTSSQSINRQFAAYSASLVLGAQVTDLDLRSFNVPLFSVDEEESQGIPQAAKDFLIQIDAHDALVVSLAEHNGSYTAAFKNLYDWASRERYEVWGGKPMILLATSPGGRGGASVLAAAEATFPRMGADLKGTFSLPSFGENFSKGKGILEQSLRSELEAVMVLMNS